MATAKVCRRIMRRQFGCIALVQTGGFPLASTIWVKCTFTARAFSKILFTHLCGGSCLQSKVMRAKGVDEIVCLSVNDVFVMGAWADTQGAGDKVTLLADGNCELSSAIGLEFDGSKFGMGTRSQRYAAIIENGVVKYLAVEEPAQFKVSSAEAVLEAL